MPDSKILKETKVKVVPLKEAIKGADVIYTDSWRSYHIKGSEMSRRIRSLKSFQVNKKNFNNKAYFMHCLPAKRGEEVTKDIIDGKRSIILKQAENREHIQKAILLKLLKKG